MQTGRSFCTFFVFVSSFLFAFGAGGGASGWQVGVGVAPGCRAGGEWGPGVNGRRARDVIAATSVRGWRGAAPIKRRRLVARVIRAPHPAAATPQRRQPSHSHSLSQVCTFFLLPKHPQHHPGKLNGRTLPFLFFRFCSLVRCVAPFLCTGERG